MSPRPLFSVMCVLSLTLAAPGCHGRIPKSGPTRESGQSGLMNESFAAKNACNPENHLRPFIIEWDATDRSSFEAYAANDVVVVRYEGCNMMVLEECRNDSVRGEQGAYKPVEWTSGALEKLNISNQGELVAKLPLSVGTLGGRVAGGEKFSMEYFVSGTRTSTRPAVYREDLASNPGCEGATHFVYGINLGAFALGSVTEFIAEASASLYGFGAGGKNERSRTADKQGGDLGTCKGDTAKDVEGCKSPIRLTLRPIRDGANPEKAAMKAPDTEESLNAAGAVNMKIEMSAEANARIDAARQKIVSKDGKGCLAELDAYDKLEPKRKTTDPKTAWTQYRAQCLMLAGKCDPGKELIRKWFENNLSGAAQSPEMIDSSVDFQAQTYCQGKMSPRDEMLKGYTELAMSRTSKRKAEECEESYQRVAKHLGKVKPRDEDDHQVIFASRDLGAVAAPCFAGAGDCKRAFELYKKHYDMTRFKGVDPKYHDEGIVSAFNVTAPKCAPKPAQ